MIDDCETLYLWLLFTYLPRYFLQIALYLLQKCKLFHISMKVDLLTKTNVACSICNFVFVGIPTESSIVLLQGLD